MRELRLEEALQEGLPASVLVQLVEDDHGDNFPEFGEAQVGSDPGGTREQESAMVEVVPVQVRGGMLAAGGRLADLPRPRHERHLPPALAVLLEQGVVETWNRRDHLSSHLCLVRTILRQSDVSGEPVLADRRSPSG